MLCSGCVVTVQSGTRSEGTASQSAIRRCNMTGRQLDRMAKTNPPSWGLEGGSRNRPIRQQATLDNPERGAASSVDNQLSGVRCTRPRGLQYSMRYSREEAKPEAAATCEVTTTLRSGCGWAWRCFRREASPKPRRGGSEEGDKDSKTTAGGAPDSGSMLTLTLTLVLGQSAPVSASVPVPVPSRAVPPQEAERTAPC